MPDPIFVIGAGIGGLSAAVRLATAGRQVVILEGTRQLGGKMGEIRAGGYRWDTGPSVITLRHVLDDLFAVAGRDMADYLNLRPVEPLTRYFYPDGTVLDLSRDLAHTLAQIQEIKARDVEGYLKFLAYAARLYRITSPVFIYDQPPRLSSLLQVSPLDAMRIDGFRTMSQAINRFVRSPHLRQLLGRFATYVGEPGGLVSRGWRVPDRPGFGPAG
jgi:phytoene desaturase